VTVLLTIAERCAGGQALKHLSQTVRDSDGASTCFPREIGNGCYANVTGSPLYAGLWRDRMLQARLVRT
jgi:hypothetical protein